MEPGSSIFTVGALSSTSSSTAGGVSEATVASTDCSDSNPPVHEIGQPTFYISGQLRDSVDTLKQPEDEVREQNDPQKDGDYWKESDGI